MNCHGDGAFLFSYKQLGLFAPLDQFFGRIFLLEGVEPRRREKAESEQGAKVSDGETDVGGSQQRDLGLGIQV